jgi:phosphoribosylanthranilate isomerase
MLATPRIKICCIASIDEAWIAMRHGASALGLVSAMPSGPGPIDEVTIAQIARSVPPGVATFLLTALTDADAIIEQHRRCGTTTIQLVDAVPPGTHARLRRALPGIGIVQVIHVTGEDAVDDACALAADVDALLLDSGNPSLAVKELGGTGRVHDWRVSRRIVERCGKPVYLAGGLRPDNVAEAVATVRPFGLDLCSGVRTAGCLDPGVLDRFVTAVRGGPDRHTSFDRDREI